MSTHWGHRPAVNATIQKASSPQLCSVVHPSWETSGCPWFSFHLDAEACHPTKRHFLHKIIKGTASFCSECGPRVCVGSYTEYHVDCHDVSTCHCRFFRLNKYVTVYTWSSFLPSSVPYGWIILLAPTTTVKVGTRTPQRQSQLKYENSNC